MTRRGRDAPVVTWPFFWVTVVFGLVVNLPDRSNVNSIAGVGVNALVVVASVLVMFAVMWVLEPLVMGGPASQRTVRAFILIAIGSLARAPVLSALLLTTGISDARWAYRALSGLLLYAPILTIAASVITLLHANAERRADFAADAERLSHEEHEAWARTQAYRARAMDGIRTMLVDRLTTLRTGGGTDLGTQLRSDVDGVIRPLSHRMAGRAMAGPVPPGTTSAPRVRWADVWRTGLLGQPIRPALIGAIMTLASLVSLSWYAGSHAWGVASAVVGGVLVYLLMLVLRGVLQGRLRSMPPGRRAIVFTIAVAACLIVPAAVLVLMLMASGSTPPWRVPIAFAVVGTVFAWLVALDQGLRLQVAATASEMQARTAQMQHATASAQSVAYHEERRLSRALHGPVQAAVTSAAMRVEAGDTTGAEQLLLDAIGHLDANDTDERGVGRALDDIAAAWDGLCAVDVDIAPDAQRAIDADAPLTSSVIDICTEACSNAVRHADAEHISVMARRAGDTVTLVVRDDGAPSGNEPLPGLGSAMLDDVTLHWERRREGRATVLRATLPCR